MYIYQLIFNTSTYHSKKHQKHQNHQQISEYNFTKCSPGITLRIKILIYIALKHTDNNMFTFTFSPFSLFIYSKQLNKGKHISKRKIVFTNTKHHSRHRSNITYIKPQQYVYSSYQPSLSSFYI